LLLDFIFTFSLHFTTHFFFNQSCGYLLLCRLGEDESVYALQQKYPTVHLVLKESVVRKIHRQKMSRLSSVPLPKLPPPPSSEGTAVSSPQLNPSAPPSTPSRVVRAYVNAADIFDGVVSLARFKTLVLRPGTTAAQLKVQLVSKVAKGWSHVRAALSNSLLLNSLELSPTCFFFFLLLLSFLLSFFRSSAM
jgi:hypothetical protein